MNSQLFLNPFVTSPPSLQDYPYPKFCTNSPIVTGSSIIGILCSDCVILAADTLGSYGSLSRFTSISRIIEVGKNTVVAVTGDLADFQYISDRLGEKIRQAELLLDSIDIGPREIYSWLNRVLYYRRTKLQPLWLNLVVAGWDYSLCSGGTPFLSYIDMVGTAFEDVSIATGIGSYLIKPLLRKALSNLEDQHFLTINQGMALLSDCMKALFYRDCRAYPQYYTVSISKLGVVINEPVKDFGSWKIAEYVNGYD